MRRNYWADEMGLQSWQDLWSCEPTPVKKKTGSRFKVNIHAAISPQGFMNWMVLENNCDSNKFIEFLARLRSQVKQKCFRLSIIIACITVKKYNRMLRNINRI